MSSLFTALQFAVKAHDGQKRKYTDEPYINHPLSVAAIVAEVSDDEDMVVAAVLHDTVEDTPTTIEEVTSLFGKKVGQMVAELTDVSKPADGNRKIRKKIDREHTSQASPEAQTIKLADLIDNTRTIVRHDPRFAAVYMAEKRNLLEVLEEGSPKLLNQAKMLVRRFFEKAETAHERRI